MKKLFFVFLIFIASSANLWAHRSGCHAKHSCPSDNDSYICGDTGNCSECFDNIYCVNKKNRSQSGAKFTPDQVDPLKPFSTPDIQKSPLRKVVHVIDGDTLLLENKEKVRLIGVDTPESVHRHKPVEYFGKEASAFTKKMVEGKNVRLSFENSLHDMYGRTLAYVFLEDGTFLNAEIIKQGYGFAYTRFPFKWKKLFRYYEKEAQFNKKGMWKK
ncbi:MAG: thermonuclease family protein [Deltaproteobacteria bacterium]|nr:thermonuclease family protein [Deltaproteobacteria bacterium]